MTSSGKAVDEVIAIVGGFSSWKDLLDTNVLDKVVTILHEIREIELLNSIPGQIFDVATKLNQIETCLRWLIDGMECNQPTFQIKDMGAHGNGLVARTEIPENSQILSIPVSLLIQSTLSPPLDFLRKDPLCTQFPSVSLALNLLLETFSESSSFKPYIAVLPRNFLLPFYYKTSDFEALGVSPSTHATAIQLLYNSIRQFMYLRRIFQANPVLTSTQFSLSNYLWALGVVLTRQNNVPTPDNPSSLALIPGWDMCNHANGNMTTYSTSDGIVCDAMRTFSPGEEITICYGPRSNSDLLLYSGFTIQDNPHDRAQLVVNLQSSDPLIKIRLLLLQKRKAAVSNNSIALYLNADGKLASPHYRQQLQLLVLDKAQLAQALRQDDEAIRAGDIVPWTSELAVKSANELIHNICATQIEGLSNAIKNQGAHASIVNFLEHERSVYEHALAQIEFISN